MSVIVYDLGDNASLCAATVRHMGARPGSLERRRFPDGESYLRFHDDCSGRSVALFCSLDRPDPKLAPLLLAAASLRELGAGRVGLIAPYLAYMRQDAVFQPGEAVTARHFAALLSASFDWLVTVDPHLHRIHSLDEVYTLSTSVVAAMPAVAEWIGANVRRPLLIGPDTESSQWVARAAELTSAPCLILHKTRHGDRSVAVTAPQIEPYRDCVPVVIDDIVSSGRTMVETLRHLRKAGSLPPVCIAVHAIFADGAVDGLRAAGAERIVSCNSVRHESNGIDLAALIAAAAVSRGA